MKKTGIINSEVSAVVANMGHMDWLSIGDAGMPVPFGTKKIIWLLIRNCQALWTY